MNLKNSWLIIVLCLISSAMLPLNAQTKEQSDWYYTSFDKAEEAAKASNKPLFIYLHKPNCGRCVSTWNGITKDKKLVARLKKEVVLVYINTKTNEKDFSKGFFHIRKKGGSFGTPLIGIVRTNGKVAVDHEGYASVEKINEFLDKL